MIDTPHAERDTLYFHSTPTPVPIFQRQWEFEQLLKLYAERAPRRVLEIGTFHGGTLYHWLMQAAPEAKIVSVDSYAAGVDNRKLFRLWASQTDVQLILLAGDSRSPDTVSKVAQLGLYDWIFIDAGHLLDEVQADWEHYGPMCAPGGIVAFHDIMPAAVEWIQVAPLWESIQHQGYITQEFVCNVGLDWSGIGVVYL